MTSLSQERRVKRGARGVLTPLFGSESDSDGTIYAFPPSPADSNTDSDDIKNLERSSSAVAAEQPRMQQGQKYQPRKVPPAPAKTGLRPGSSRISKYDFLGL